MINQILAAVMDNLVPLIVAGLLALVALGYRHALIRVKALVAETPSELDDQAFDAFVKELRKRKLLPDGYDEDVAKAKEAAKKK